VIHKRITGLLAVVALLLPQGFSVRAAAPDNYGKLMKDVVATAEGPFITLHRTAKDKILAEYPVELLGRELLVGGTVSSVSDAGGMAVGMKQNPPLCLRIERQDSLVVLVKPTVRAVTKDPSMAAAMQRNYYPSIYRRIPLTWSSDSSAVIFDITFLVTDTVKGFSSGLSDKSSWFGEMKSFSDNVSLKVFYGKDLSTGYTKTKGTVSETVSILLLPKEKMPLKLADSRIGVFSTTVPRVELTPDEDGMKPFRLANRWRPGRKIVWYVDDSFPEDWKEPIRQGILAWNDAFRNAGLGDVLDVRDFPSVEEDPEFDPDNLKYNCVRYVPNGTMNAMGPSWVDPSTGEILNATVLIYNDVVRLLNRWRFVMTAQVDPAVRAKKMPREIVAESMVYVVSHEIGHTLGLMHNMAASSAYPVEKLRDPAFTAEFGTTPSIMDYARFNYVAQPSDTEVSLIPPRLGVYDYYAIEWLYGSVPGAEDPWEEAAVKARLIESHETDPMYRFSAQGSSSAAMTEYDPTARKNDLGDDPIAAGNYGVANLKYILPHLNEWIDDDADGSHRKALYDNMVSQYNRYLLNVVALIGGIRLNTVRDEAGIPAVDPVPASIQKEALRWTVSSVRDLSWLDAPEVTARYGLSSPASAKEASALAVRLAGQAATGVMLSSLNGGDYTVEAYFDDLYDEVFRGRLTPSMKALQRELVSYLSRSTGTFLRSSGKALEDSVPYGNEACFGDADGPIQRSVDPGAADETKAARLEMLVKVKKMAASKRKSGPEKTHYEYLYRIAQSTLGE